MKRVFYGLLVILISAVVFSACGNSDSPLAPTNHLAISPATRDIHVNIAACFTAVGGGAGTYTWDLNVSSSYFSAGENSVCFVPMVLGPYKLTVKWGGQTASATGTVFRP